VAPAAEASSAGAAGWRSPGGVSERALRFDTGARSGEVSARLLRPDRADRLLVLAHGAGAGMGHPFMQAVAEALASRRLASFRFDFPFMQGGRRGPNPPAVLVASVRAAVQAAARAAPDLPLFAGGKSLGGRMTSTAAAEAPLAGVRGLVFLGFPLHAPGRPSTLRADHLRDVGLPLLFLQGTRDKLAELSLLEPVCRELGERATLHVVEGGDHSFHVLKRSGRSDEQVLAELADAIASWTQSLL
jgi:predicted alpha/beta-hydrolase family hydrolase